MSLTSPLLPWTFRRQQRRRGEQQRGRWPTAADHLDLLLIHLNTWPQDREGAEDLSPFVLLQEFGEVVSPSTSTIGRW